VPSDFPSLRGKYRLVDVSVSLYVFVAVCLCFTHYNCEKRVGFSSNLE